MWRCGDCYGPDCSEQVLLLRLHDGLALALLTLLNHSRYLCRLSDSLWALVRLQESGSGADCRDVVMFPIVQALLRSQVEWATDVAMVLLQRLCGLPTTPSAMPMLTSLAMIAPIDDEGQ